MGALMTGGSPPRLGRAGAPERPGLCRLFASLSGGGGIRTLDGPNRPITVFETIVDRFETGRCAGVSRVRVGVLRSACDRLDGKLREFWETPNARARAGNPLCRSGPPPRPWAYGIRRVSFPSEIRTRKRRRPVAPPRSRRMLSSGNAGENRLSSRHLNGCPIPGREGDVAPSDPLGDPADAAQVAA